MRGNFKHTVWFLLKTFVVLLLCLVVSLWFHRKKIVSYAVNRQLHEFGVDDLQFKVSELSPGCLELRDIVWGLDDDPCMILAGLRVEFSLKGLLKRRVDLVELNRFESGLKLNKKNQLDSVLLDRSRQVLKRYNELYPPAAGKVTESSLNLPELVLKRSSVVVRGYDGFECGRIDFMAASGSDSGTLGFKGEYTIPGGRRVAFQSSTRINFSQVDSSLSAGFEGAVDLGRLVDSSARLAPETVSFTGQLTMKMIEGEPEWNLNLRMPPVQYELQVQDCRTDAFLSGEVNFKGTSTYLSGNGEFGLSNLHTVVSADAGVQILSNSVEYAFFDFKLPETAFSDFNTVQASCRLGLSNVCAVAKDFVFENGCLEIPFTAAGETGVDFGQMLFGWEQCSVKGVVDLQPAGFDINLFSGELRVKSGVSIDNEPLEIKVECNIPLYDPLSGKLYLEVPEAVLKSDGAFGKLLEKKSGKHFDFSATLSASATLESFKPGAPVRGGISLKNGECSGENLNLAGLNIEIPFEFNGTLKSSGAPVVSVETVDIGNIHLSAGELLFHIQEREVFIEKAHIGWAKGYLRAYSVHAGFDGNILNEFVIYADRIDMGDVFMLVTPMEGKMEGVLYGRFAIGLKNKRVDLSTGYLYSLPGQGGYIRIDDPARMESLLRRAGISRDVEEIARALCDLALSTIRLDLDPGKGEDSSLRIRLAGKSNYEKRPAPVDLNLNLNGPLDEVLNLGVDMKRLIKH